MSQGVFTRVPKPRVTSETRRFQQRVMSDISLTFPRSIQYGAVSKQHQKYLWISLRATLALRDADLPGDGLNSGDGDEERGPREI